MQTDGYAVSFVCKNKEQSMINLDLEDFSPEETKTTFKLWACDPGYSSPYVAVDGHGTSTYQIRQVSAKEYYHLGWLRLLIAELKRWKKNSSLSIPPVWYPSPVGLLPPQDYPTRSSLSGGCHRLHQHPAQTPGGHGILHFIIAHQ